MSEAVGVNSPCINVCVINADTGHCFGCYRTVDEIAGWPGYSPGEKAELLEDLKRRHTEADPID
jgi:predicted Fe-S protein YdhL (DUF1289 family)